MYADPALQLDLSPYVGQSVIVGCTAEAFLRRRKGPQWYILGTIDPEAPALPEHVIAIIADDQHDHGEELFVCLVEPRRVGYAVKTRPLIVLDEQGRLLYGLEVLQAIIQTTVTIETVTVAGVRLPEKA